MGAAVQRTYRLRVVEHERERGQKRARVLGNQVHGHQAPPKPAVERKRHTGCRVYVAARDARRSQGGYHGAHAKGHARGERVRALLGHHVGRDTSVADELQVRAGGARLVRVDYALLERAHSSTLTTSRKVPNSSALNRDTSWRIELAIL